VSSKILAGDREQDIAVTITMPRGRAEVRPPLSLAIVIDRSGSMEGEPLANAKAAAAQLVGQLSSRDAFSIITYSSSVETVVPLTRATGSAKDRAQAEIAKIWDDGNTCISCGIERATEELAGTTLDGGVRRMVLISDGQANTGKYDRNELAQLAIETAARGVSISTVGVGLDFDEVTMTRLADVGHGHYYFVEDTARLGAMFAEELGGLTETVAADARLVITQQGAYIEEAYGYPIMRQGDQVVVPIADLRAGETRKVVLRSTIRSSAPGALPVAAFELHWRRTNDGRQDTARATLATTIVTDQAAVAASIDRGAVNAVEQARTARVLEEATRTYETQGAEAAQRVIERNVARVRANKNMDAPAMQAIEAASSGASQNFATAPATKAKKATRADAYKLAH
jgi:Ca-activated chloride channel family protein